MAKKSGIKAIDGKPSRVQMDWIKALTVEKNFAVVCYGADEATDTILRYLEGRI